MYIPKEIIWFILGFIAFPIFAYAIYCVMEKKDVKEIEDASNEDKGSNN